MSMDNNDDVKRVLKVVAQLSVDKASRSLSKIAKAGSRITLERAEMINVSDVTARMNGEDRAIVGSFVDLIGDINFKFLFYTEAFDSLSLAEIILGKERKAIKDFELYARSAVQEVSNILASAVASVFSMDLDVKIKPTPPIVVHDLIGPIFQEYVLNAASDLDEILMIESNFCIVRHDIKCQMYILPMAGSEEKLMQICKTFKS